MIILDGVSKSFDGGQSYAVRELSLQVYDGETLVLLGSSGCGKSTTLKMINRLIEPTNGTIQVDDRDVTQQDPVMLRRTIGYVFQGTWSISALSGHPEHRNRPQTRWMVGEQAQEASPRSHGIGWSATRRILRPVSR